jgi:hypothetical protein
MMSNVRQMGFTEDNTPTRTNSLDSLICQFLQETHTFEKRSASSEGQEMRASGYHISLSVENQFTGNELILKIQAPLMGVARGGLMVSIAIAIIKKVQQQSLQH